MATIQRGILSGFSGAIGSVTGAKSKGIDTMRARVTKPKNPRSTRQLASRLIFSNIQSCFDTLQLHPDLPDNFLNLNNKIIQQQFKDFYLKIFYSNTPNYIGENSPYCNKKGDIPILDSNKYADRWISDIYSKKTPNAPESSLSDIYCTIATSFSNKTTIIEIFPDEIYRDMEDYYDSMNYSLDVSSNNLIYTYFWISSDFSKIFNGVTSIGKHPF